MNSNFRELPSIKRLSFYHYLPGDKIVVHTGTPLMEEEADIIQRIISGRLGVPPGDILVLPQVLEITVVSDADRYLRTTAVPTGSAPTESEG